MSHSKDLGLDTSFVLRLLTGVPVEQAALAVRQLDELVSAGKQAVVSDLVITEVYFALQHHYQVPKQLALDTLRDFMDAPEIGCLGHAVSVLAEPHLARAKPGFADRLIHAEYLAQSGGMLSFEKAAKKLPGVTVPS